MTDVAWAEQLLNQWKQAREEHRARTGLTNDLQVGYDSGWALCIAELELKIAYERKVAGAEMTNGRINYNAFVPVIGREHGD